MKYSIISLTAIIVSLTLTSCSSPSSERHLKHNAKHYVQAMADYRVEDAMPYATPETQQITLNYLLKNIMPHMDTNYIHSNTPAKITLDSVKYSNDSVATVFYRKTTPLVDNMQATIEMHLHNGEWLAHQIIQGLPFLGMIPQHPRDTNIRLQAATEE